MALIKCLECGNDVSDKASACPKCGAPVTAQALPASMAPASIQAVPVGAQTPTASSAPNSAAPKPSKPKKPFFTVGRVLAWVFIIGGGWLAFKLLTGSSLAGAVHGPQTIVNEQIQLSEGEAMSYGFALPSSRRVDVEVSAKPARVNVMLMTSDQWSKYEKAKGSLWGGKYQYTRALSSQNVLTWKGSDVLPAGTWRIVVERPSESVLFRDSTNATVMIVGH